MYEIRLHGGEYKNKSLKEDLDEDGSAKNGPHHHGDGDGDDDDGKDGAAVGEQSTEHL